MTFGSGTGRRLLTIGAVCCAVLGLIVAASAMPMLASESPASDLLGGSDQESTSGAALTEEQAAAAQSGGGGSLDGGSPDGGGSVDGGAAGELPGEMPGDELVQRAAASDNPLVRAALYGLASLASLFGTPSGAPDAAGADPAAAGLDGEFGDQLDSSVEPEELPETDDDGASQDDTEGSDLEDGSDAPGPDDGTETETNTEAETGGGDAPDGETGDGTDPDSGTDGGDTESDPDGDAGDSDTGDGGDAEDGGETERDADETGTDGETDDSGGETDGQSNDGDAGSEPDPDGETDEAGSSPDGSDGETDPSADGADEDGTAGANEDGSAGDETGGNDGTETDETGGDDETADEDAGLEDSMLGLSDGTLTAALAVLAVAAVGYVFYTRDDPIGTLRSIPSRLVSLALSAVVACSQGLERAVARLRELRSIADLPGLILTALGEAIRSTTTRVRSVGASLSPFGDADAADSEAVAEAQVTARDRIRRAFASVIDAAPMYRASVATATPAEVARRASDAGAPAEPVETITDSFRDVEYGDRDPESYLERTTSAHDRLRAALEAAQAGAETETGAEPAAEGGESTANPAGVDANE